MQIIVGNWSYEFNRELQANNEIRIKQYNIKGRPDYSYYIYRRIVQLPAKNNITIDPVDTLQRIVKGKGLPILSNPTINQINLTSQWLSRKRRTTEQQYMYILKEHLSQIKHKQIVAGNWTLNIGTQQEGKRIKVYQDGIKGRPRSQDVYIFPS